MTAKRCLILALVLIALDALSKMWINQLVATVPSPLPYMVFSDFFGIRMQITHAINMGAAWGVLADFPNALVFVRILLISALIVYFFGVNHRPSWNVPLCLIISGAIGNVIDYFHYGYVIDMIQMNFWGYDYPIFNIADSAIFIGSFWILFSATMEKSKA
ncbi:MAG: signal peptidase II [Verrucomicrobia bacterium]|nr:signal peptidase II [Verrucomicrobiota bacterium]MBS0636125.1 signal peptidase II [Verrucomicrobiota bacterium]